MLKLSEYANFDALDLMALLRRREVSAQELHQTAMAALEALNPKLNAVVGLSSEDAQRALAALADGNTDAPFAGLPFLVKEGVGMKGQRACMASRLAEHMLCESDSEFMRRLRATGVVILGTTNVPEMAASPTTESIVHGAARNPWNLAHSTGGSSGGSSAAVAAGLVPVAQTSDGAGSIRTPAHCCGNFGLKPTRGRNPIGPGSYGGPFGPACQHVSSRSVRDSAAFLDHLHGPELGGHYRVQSPAKPFLQEVGVAPGRLRVAFSSASPSGVPAHPEVAAAVHEAARLCAELGHRVEECAPRYDWEEFFGAFADLFNVGLYMGVKNLGSMTGLRPEDQLESGTLAAYRHGEGVTMERFFRASSTMYGITHRFESFFQDWDVWLCPVNLTPARKLGELNPPKPYRDFRHWWDESVAPVCPHTPIANLSGLPAMSVPFALSSEGLPIGVQFFGRYADEATLFRLAAQIEAARPWAHLRPRVHAANL